MNDQQIDFDADVVFEGGEAQTENSDQVNTMRTETMGDTQRILKSQVFSSVTFSLRDNPTQDIKQEALARVNLEDQVQLNP